MDSNNTQKKEIEIDLKDAFQYILYKGWIVILATLLAVVIAFVYTNVILKELYTSTSKLFVTNESESNVVSTTDWNLGKQYAVSSKEFVTIDFCQTVANRLNNENLPDGETAYDCYPYLGTKSFTDFYKEVTGKDKISATDLYKYLRIETNSNTCTMTVTAETPNGYLSAIIANSVSYYFEDYLIDILDNDQVKAKVLDTGKISGVPSNVHVVRNIVLGFFIGFVLSCGALFVAFMIDDKIKTPEDVEKYLGISVLGTIPEIEKEI